MTRDDRFYAFIVARTSHSRSHIRRICLHKRWLKVFAVLLLTVLCGLLYGFYGLTQQAQHLRIEQENQRLRAENEKQRQELRNLDNRVDAVEDTSRRLAEISGLTLSQQGGLHGDLSSGATPARGSRSAAKNAAPSSATDYGLRRPVVSSFPRVPFSRSANPPSS